MVMWLLLVLGLCVPFSLVAGDISLPEGLFLHSGLDASFVARFALFVAVILLWTLFSGKILKKIFKLPVIAGQIVGGIILGPTILNITQWKIFSHPLIMSDAASQASFAITASDLYIFVVLLIAAVWAVSYLLWVAGYESDIHDILKVGDIAIGAGILGAVLPIVMVAGFFYYCLPGTLSMTAAAGIGLIFAATSVSIPVAMLVSQNKMHLRTSKATLGAAIIDDIVAVILLALFFILVQAGLLGGGAAHLDSAHAPSLGSALGAMLYSIVVMFAVGYFIVPRIMAWLKKQDYFHLIAPVAFGIMLIYFAFADLFGGLAGITGAYFAGLFHRRGDTKSVAEKALTPYSNAILLPLFLGSIGLQLDFRVLSLGGWGMVAILLFIAIISKVGGCYLVALVSNLFAKNKSARWSSLESYIFGASMVARGEVGLVIATILNSAKVLSMDYYVISVAVIVLTTIATPILLALGFSRLEVVPVAQPEGQAYALDLGAFKYIGTTQMFNIIVGILEKDHKLTAQFNEGRRIVALEGKNVEIILCPHEGILFRGDKNGILEIVNKVKKTIVAEAEQLTA